MKKIDLGQTITILANAGVIGGLIFVGLQLRQERQIAMADGVDDAAERAAAWVHVVADNAEVWQKGLIGEPLTAIEQLVFDEMVAAWEIKLFTAWNRANLGITEQESIRFAREAAIALYRNPGLLEAWNDFRARMRYVGAAGAIRENNPDAPVWEAVVRQELEALRQVGFHE